MHDVKNVGIMRKSHRNNMLLLYIRADTFCTPNSFEPRQRYARVRSSSNLQCAAVPLSSPKNTTKIVHFDPVLPDKRARRESSSKSNQTLFRRREKGESEEGEKVICVEEQHQGLPARSPVDFVRRQGGLSDGVLVFFNKLG